MAITIKQMTKTDAGAYNLGEDMLPDMWDGEVATSVADVTYWLQDQGYEDVTEVEGYKGWGVVMRHRDTDELVSVDGARNA